MIEVCPNLFVGSDADFPIVNLLKDWFIVQAAKEPWHREALGYTTRSAPADDPEYLYALRDNRLILNLVDAQEERYIPFTILDAAIGFIGKELESGHKVLVHCNQGESRAPSIALLYMVKAGLLPQDYDGAFFKFLEIYPAYNPGQGIASFTINNFHRFLTTHG
jgi:hypothetical protein